MVQRHFQEVRSLVPSTPRDPRDGVHVRKLAVARAVQTLQDITPALSSDDAETVTYGLRLAMDAAIEQVRRQRIGGVPSQDDLRVIRQRLQRSFAMTDEEFAAVLVGYPMPSTVD